MWVLATEVSISGRAKAITVRHERTRCDGVLTVRRPLGLAREVEHVVHGRLASSHGLGDSELTSEVILGEQPRRWDREVPMVHVRRPARGKVRGMGIPCGCVVRGRTVIPSVHVASEVVVIDCSGAMRK